MRTLENMMKIMNHNFTFCGSMGLEICKYNRKMNCKFKDLKLKVSRGPFRK